MRAVWKQVGIGLMVAIPLTTGAARAATDVHAFRFLVRKATPLRFEPNHGQSDARVRFLARGTGYTLFLTPSAAVVATGISGETRVEDSREHVGPRKSPSAKRRKTIVE